MKYQNFYESLEEARARLEKTIVLYDGLPYYIIAITDHMKDGIFRAYLDPVGKTPKERSSNDIAEIYGISGNYGSPGKTYDAYVDSGRGGILRKYLSSEKFNNFRPFPLGMCVAGTQVYYVERQPIRPSMHQGLTRSGCYETLVTSGSSVDRRRQLIDKVDIMSEGFKDCILGDHHSPSVVLEALKDPDVVNEGLPIGRDFAIIRGPMDMLFLVYRSNTIGLLTDADFSCLRLGKQFSYCREAVQELGIFQRII